jgi:hypothetical protein
MSTYADPLVVNAEIDRRFELAGLDPRDRHHHAVRDLPSPPLAAHPLAAFVARLVGGRGPTTQVRPDATPCHE